MRDGRNDQARHDKDLQRDRQEGNHVVASMNKVGNFFAETDGIEPIAGVYAIWCGDEVYVGQSTNIMVRWETHMGELRKHKHKTPKLQAFYDEHDACHIRFEILEVTDPEDALRAETKWGRRLHDKLLNNKPFDPKALSFYYETIRKDDVDIHPDWQRWMDACVYTHIEARKELGLANGTFYRRIAKAPTLIDRLAMRALYEGLEPY